MNAWLILGSSLRLKTQGSIGNLTAHNKIPRKVQWYSFLPRVGGLRYLWFSSLAVRAWGVQYFRGHGFSQDEPRDSNIALIFWNMP